MRFSGCCTFSYGAFWSYRKAKNTNSARHYSMCFPQFLNKHQNHRNLMKLCVFDYKKHSNQREHNQIMFRIHQRISERVQENLQHPCGCMFCASKKHHSAEFGARLHQWKEIRTVSSVCFHAEYCSIRFPLRPVIRPPRPPASLPSPEFRLQ